MTGRHAATALADLLERENAALAALDLGGAAAMLAEKQQAVAALAAAPADTLPAAERRRLAERLRRLAEENRLLLEQGLRVQGRVIGMLVQALPRPAVPRYGAGGAIAPSGTAPLIVSARA